MGYPLKRQGGLSKTGVLGCLREMAQRWLAEKISQNDYNGQSWCKGPCRIPRSIDRAAVARTEQKLVIRAGLGARGMVFRSVFLSTQYLETEAEPTIEVALEQWFSNLNVHENDLEGLLR